MSPTTTQVQVRLRTPHSQQMALIQDQVKRKIGRAGRRSGKTTGVATLAVDQFINGKRVLYATPTADQITRFWFEVKRALGDGVDSKHIYCNETQHILEIPGTETRIRAKTAWNADTLRGDYADLLILDEWQLMDEDAWELVGAPMLLDNNGDAVFLYTPPSLRSRSVSKARDPRHAAKMFQAAQEDRTGRWKAYHFTSHDNPHISRQALADIVQDMTTLAIRQEIMAEDVDEAPGALWSRNMIESGRLREVPVALIRIVVGCDPPGGATECGIVAVGRGADGHGYVLADGSLQTSPEGWAGRILDILESVDGDMVVGEANYGGDMVESNIRMAARSRGDSVRYKNVHATRGKAVRAQPVVATYERGEMHHVGSFPALEDEMVLWIPGETGNSPNRMDALVWAATEVMIQDKGRAGVRSFTL